MNIIKKSCRVVGGVFAVVACIPLACVLAVLWAATVPVFYVFAGLLVVAGNLLSVRLDLTVN